VYRTAWGLLVTLLIASPAGYGAPPADGLVQDLIAQAQTIILVRVVESFHDPQFPPKFNSPERFVPVLGTVRVLKSWKGPFPTGRKLYVGATVLCAGTPDSCEDYPLKAGDELLIFFPGATEPIYAARRSTWPAAETQGLMQALDQAVKERSGAARHPGSAP
jgi:hypothetical protein